MADTISFDGRVAIVTGAGNGLGRSHALEIGRRGGSVVVNDLGVTVDGRSEGSNPAERVVEEIHSFGGSAVASHDSVATVDGGKAIVQTALDAYGRLDIVINNAGIMRNASFAETDIADVDAMYATHVRGAFCVSQPAFRVMRDAGYGRIVFTASAAAYGSANQAGYAAAKGAVLALTNVVAIEGAPHGIRVNALLPAAVTRMATALSEEEAAVYTRIGPKLGATSAPEFATAMAVYLASETCEVTQQAFSSAAGRYARVFLAAAQGWCGPRFEAPTPEDIRAHLAQIADTHQPVVPNSIVHEFELIAAQVDGA